MGINDLIKIGDKIKHYRKQLGITQAEMAEKIGLPRSTYAHYENNTREPDIKIIEKICKVLNIGFYDLIDNNNFFVGSGEEGLELVERVEFNSDLMGKILSEFAITENLNFTLMDSDLELLTNLVKRYTIDILNLLTIKNLNHIKNVADYEDEIYKINKK